MIDQEQQECLEWHAYMQSLDFQFSVNTLRNVHSNYVLCATRSLARHFTSLDASQPWLCYWTLHALELITNTHVDHLIDPADVIRKLATCQNATGGFGGGPGQISHLATTYAATLALMTLGTELAYQLIDRDTMLRFLLSLKQSNGSFVMHVGGEVDVRGSYCALTVAHLLNITTPTLLDQVAEFIGQCQTYEGGLGAQPNNEAHGGYTFCGIATLALLNRFDVVDLDALAGWLTRRQMDTEGGFNGRTNKLVDGCYSFWQGAVVPLVHAALVQRGTVKPWTRFQLMDTVALKQFIWKCTQKPEGGFTDRYDRNPDYYHTCYCLSGLSICEHQVWPVLGSPFEVIIPDEDMSDDDDDGTLTQHAEEEKLTRATHPIFNISLRKLDACYKYFYSSGSQLK